MMRVLVIFEKTTTGYSAYLPDFPGCVSTGATKQDCENHIAEAFRLHIEGLKAEGLPFPESNSESEILLIGA